VPQGSDLSLFGADAVNLTGFPIVISNEGRLDTIVADFMIERSLGSWCGISGARLSANSIIDLVRDFIGFQNYCAALGVDWVSFERRDQTGERDWLCQCYDFGSWAFRSRPV
jgi:hypothetical protein